MRMDTFLSIRMKNSDGNQDPEVAIYSETGNLALIRHEYNLIVAFFVEHTDGSQTR